jgi:hypothetical protein
VSPYLFELLNGWQTPLVAAVGAGVGAAATIGVLRFLRGLAAGLLTWRL